MGARIFKHVFSMVAIGLVVGTLLVLLSPTGNWLGIYAYSLVFSICISLAIDITIHFSKSLLQGYSRTRQIPLYGLIFIFGGAVGTLAGSGLLSLFSFGAAPDFWQLFNNLLGFNQFLAIIFGSVAIVYAYFKNRQAADQVALQREQAQQRELRHLKTSAELKMLQAQINPHFLFNTLNSIASLIPQSPENAERLVEQLSDYFRRTLSMSQNITTTLGQEIELVRTYLEIEKIRYGDRLAFTIDIEMPLQEFPAPALIIQPLVENSIKYAVATSKSPVTIRISASANDDMLRLIVKDDGPGLPDDWQQRGFGLHNVQERLKHLYNGTATFSGKNAGGAHFDITLPELPAGQHTANW